VADCPPEERLQLVVVFGTVELERVDAARAFFGIEPAFRQKHAHRVDAVLGFLRRGLVPPSW
jgi:hypothetical protein